MMHYTEAENEKARAANPHIFAKEPECEFLMDKLQRIRDIVHGAVTFAEVLQALIDLDNIINEPFKPEEVKKKCSN